MSVTKTEQVKENLAQLGIKRGSLIWPIIAVFIAAILLAISFQSNANAPLNTLFTQTCEGVGGQTIDANVKHPLAKQCFGTPSFEDKAATLKQFSAPSLNIWTRWEIIQELWFVETTTLNKKQTALYNAQGIWSLAADTARTYASSLYAKFGTIIADLAKTAWITALAALVPGIAGMVYRRNFWGWFTPPFVIMFVAASGIIGQQSDDGKLLVFLVSQLLIVLLALRLQRYTRKTGFLPSAVHNWILAVILTAIAVAWWLGIGGKLWTSWAGWYQWEFIFVGLPVLYTLLRRSDAWSAKAPKNIVICLDGTTNTPDQFESGRLAQTNVFKLFKMLKANANTSSGPLTHAFNASLSKRYADKQIAFYYSGVGNKFEYDPIVQALGGATGLGAAAVVDRAYLDLIRVYRPGDRIFIFGFSRGAAIARLLARAIDQRGAPRTIWTWRVLGRHWTLWQSKRAAVSKVPVTVLGCFDTVGAFGIGKNIAGIDFQKLDLFKDLTVPDNVEQAYHMVALDETREEFSPTLMEPDPIHPARLVEVWFSGDHANIGGGWGTTKLSDLTFDFLLTKISSGYAADPATMKPGNEDWGVYLSAINTAKASPEQLNGSRAFPLHPDPLGQLRLWRSAVYIYKPRQLPQHAVISETVFERMTNATPLYAPASLFNLHDELNKRRESINTAITRLKETKSVTPDEHDAILSFKDRLHLIRWPQHEQTLKQFATHPRKTLANAAPTIDKNAANSTPA